MLLLLVAVCFSPYVLAEKGESHNIRRDGIESGYYNIDKEKGFIFGIQEDTSAKSLQTCAYARACLSLNVLPMLR